ncbi:nagb/rpia/CoA transferase-like protein [Myriangium duriaei CBS 260.36]|uniref:5-formyltetrahydrofolate cyclo-ligase n=1 Tax=Myriangium duriaei CBS 260.36 TaxID=1168546 RepID=A0A9P4MJ87_9PEZI|nr:nagb/rpia/CoA transferase-like protein [Myriangium duriaei CBS 260.36]
MLRKKERREMGEVRDGNLGTLRASKRQKTKAKGETAGRGPCANRSPSDDDCPYGNSRLLPVRCATLYGNRVLHNFNADRINAVGGRQNHAMIGTARACALRLKLPAQPSVLHHTLRQMATTPAAGRVTVPVGQEAKTKAAWRKAFKNVISRLSADQVEKQSAKATSTLRDLLVYKNARSISVFLSMPGAELQTAAIVTHALQSGKDVFVPFITRKPPVMDMLQLRDEQDFRSLQPDKWGIPSLDAATVDQRINCLGFKGVGTTNITDCQGRGLDLVLMPAVAFDQNFNRLGHGKGYYDKFLTQYYKIVKQNGSSFSTPYLSKCPIHSYLGFDPAYIAAVGLALEEQILHSPHKLPAESWDVKVDAILFGGEFRPRVSPPD